ncbi:MAG: choice-of-anchor D domain-containing protein [Oscillospiraceae bacterium]|nr:choice-of-anchor D domain-containing protein [Oscillospiraceae bacterium]
MMKRRTYRLFALVLATLLVLGGFPVNALAGGQVEYAEGYEGIDFDVFTDHVRPLSRAITAPQGVPRSGITLPEDRRLTDMERETWIREYQAMGNAFAFELEVMRLTNVERARYGLQPLRLDEPLMWAARFYAQTMAQWDQLGHNIGPYESSHNVMTAFAGPHRGQRAMNGSRGRTTPQDAVAGWMNSPGHRENILRDNIRYFGVGSHADGFFHYQMFSGYPSTANLSFVTGANTYSAHFDLNGGNVDGSPTSVVRSSQPMAIGAENVPVPTRFGHTFNGWQENGTGSFLTAAQIGTRLTATNFQPMFQAAWTEDPPSWGISLCTTGIHTFPAATVGYSEQTPLTATITNTGNQPTGPLTITLSGQHDRFSLNSMFTIWNFGGVLAGGTHTFVIAPRPGLGVGTHTATITVSGANVASQSFDISFTVNPVPTWGISLTPTGPHTFPAATEGYGAQTPHTVTVANTGNQVTGALTVALSGANADDFTINRTTIPSIAAAGTDTFTVVPRIGLAIGTYTATVTVSGDANIVPQSFTVSFTVNPASTWEISLTPTGLHAFPAATEGYGAQTPYTVTVTNTGNRVTSAISITLSGTNADSFTLNRTSMPNMAAGEADTFTVVPRTGLAVGTHTATVTVRSANENAVPQSFNVSFTVDSVTPEPTRGIALNTTGTHTFPAATVGYSAQTARTVVVTNTGNQATGALTVTLSGPDADSFELNPTSLTSIPADATTRTFTVVPRTGLAVRAHTATVTVSGGHVAAQSFHVSFTVRPAPTWRIVLDTTGTHTFPAATVGYSVQTPHTVTVTNTGNQATGSLTVALSGPNADAFTLSNPTLSSIAAGETDTFTVVPNTRLTAGTHTATVTVSGGANITPRTFHVRFTVNPAAPVFVPVTAINKTSATRIETNTPLTLAATVTPANATNRTIVWSTTSTGATIRNGVLTATTAGSVVVTATITDGTTVGRPFAATFTITVRAPAAPPPVEYEYHEAYMLGNARGYFMPRTNVNRAEVAAILVRAMMDDFEAGTLPEGMERFDAFSDVSAENWFYYYVAWAYDAGLVIGSRGRFQPRDLITREQLAAMLARTTDYTEEAGKMPFPDVGNISGWADNLVYTVFTEGWMVGDSRGNFRPRANISRAEVATAVNRVLGRVDSADGLAAIANIENLDNIRIFPDVLETDWFFAAVLGAASNHRLTRDDDGAIDWKYIFPNR